MPALSISASSPTQSPSGRLITSDNEEKAMPKLTPPTIKEYERLLNLYKQHALRLFREATADERLLMEGLTTTNIYQISLSRVVSVGCPRGRPVMVACSDGSCVPP